ncbi:hypothetical protein ACHAW5_004429 [Stephanodiscus triporus]|uniref:Bud22 domain-containing protein n=1 Tax=Stephanodiscus triporus TaxID=2934178 RepID=A0ABD3Q806_9STRA
MSAATHGTNPKQSKKGKSGKRARQSPEEQYQIESIDRYNKLNHACSKHLHREAKIVKSFECQKIVRAIKAAKDSLSTGEGDDDNKDKNDIISKALKRIETLQLKLERTKNMDLDVLVQVGLKRLGVLSLDPRVNAEHNLVVDDKGDKDESTNESQQRKASLQYDDPFYQTLLESVLRHKRLSTSLDMLNDKVTEYRQWTMRREVMRRGEDNPGENLYGGNKKKKKNNRHGSASGNDTIVVAGGFHGRKRGLDLGGHEGASGLFIGSLAGNSAVAYSDGGDHDTEGNEDDEADGKKNRPGQRARRAKAKAIEARKAGKTWDSSMNWREKKKDRNGNTHDDGKKNKRLKGEDGGQDYNSRRGEWKRNEVDVGAMPKAAQHIATMGKTWKEEGNAHPSWAAAAAKKSQGMAKFEGKKITFN